MFAVMVADPGGTQDSPERITAVRRLPVTLAGLLILAGATACSSAQDEQAPPTTPHAHSAAESPSSSSPAASASPTPKASGTGHAHMHEHAMDGGPAPEGITPAANPTYPVGSEVTLTADHMPGMEGAPATVSGAYSTTAYSVNYEPTDGGPEVTDHKWVVQEEIRDAGSERLADGTPVTIEADHMPGMKGAHGTIESSTTQTVYMVDYESDGMTMTNHKWVVEDELHALD